MKNNGMEAYIDGKLGMIRIFTEEALNFIEKVSVSINDTIINPGDETTLNDFFASEVVFLGMYNDYMQFKVGEDINLLGEYTYSNEFKKIDNNRILTIHQAGTARDYIYLKEKWK